MNVEGPTVYDSLGPDAAYIKGAILLLGSYQLTSGFVTGAVEPQTPVHTGAAEPGTTGGYSAELLDVLGCSTWPDTTSTPATSRSPSRNARSCSPSWPGTPRLVDSRGLLVTNSSDGLDWDWYDGDKTGAVTEYNALYYLDLIDGATLATAAGQIAQAPPTRSRRRRCAPRSTPTSSTPRPASTTSATRRRTVCPGRQRRRRAVRRGARRRTTPAILANLKTTCGPTSTGRSPSPPAPATPKWSARSSPATNCTPGSRPATRPTRKRC